MKNNYLKQIEEKIRKDYKGIISDKQINETIEYWQEYMQIILDDEKQRLQEKIKNTKGTIHIPVGGVSNIEWFSKDEVLLMIDNI